MPSTYNKPYGVKYTDMAIYIDEYFPRLIKHEVMDEEFHEVESRIYEYLYHLVFALSYKSGFFTKLEYYDEFALYAAGQLYMTMLKRWESDGKIVRGKEVKPIKSCLNFIKSVLFPLKVNYQKDAFRTVFNPEVGHNTQKLEQNLKDAVQSEYSIPRKEAYQLAVDDLPGLVIDAMSNVPFKKNTIMYNRLYKSLILSLLSELTLSNKHKKKAEKLTEENWKEYEKKLSKLTEFYKENENDILLWHLPEDYANYVKILVVYLKKGFSERLNYYMHREDLSDDTLDSILKTAYDTDNVDNTQGE